ncbi:peptidylprolyl isomerase [Tomitella gaofuii]|uniref:peptidylprolyl isomerase n=1 Tax=Tomitella gaofuii TaxID=2760083 RepID=UPI003558413A
MSRIAVAVSAAGLVLAGCGSSDGSSDAAAATTATGAAGASAATTPPPTTAAGLCDFTASPQAAARNVHPPEDSNPPTTGTVPVTLATSVGTIGLTLDRAQAPCTVESMVSLAQQDYFDDTPCHRLTDQGIYVLQCGDPTGTGRGGPGYTIPDEFPQNLAPAEGMGPGTVVYPRGSIAMANTGRAHSGGSQFFLVYKDSPLPPEYTVFGTIDEAGLEVLDKVAAAGTKPGPGGMTAPTMEVQITDATVG